MMDLYNGILIIQSELATEEIVKHEIIPFVPCGLYFKETTERVPAVYMIDMDKVKDSKEEETKGESLGLEGRSLFHSGLFARPDPIKNMFDYNFGMPKQYILIHPSLMGEFQSALVD